MAEGKPEIVITREWLASEAFLEKLHELTGGIGRSSAELHDSLAKMLELKDPADPIWVFGYGSLMWNPAFDYEEKRAATLQGWSRKYCLWLPFGRGSAENPALTLALDEGGTTDGIVFRLLEDGGPEEMSLVWRREMGIALYVAKWVDVKTPQGTVRAVTFVADRSLPSYAGAMTDDEIASSVAVSSGQLGSARSYLNDMIGHLASTGIQDPGLSRIQELVDRKFGKNAEE